ncbi:MAG: MATE family efflux transporter, partial [Akkermansiaceae bacterium]
MLHECRQTLKLAFPLVIGQVSQMLLGVADTVMIGKLGVTELAVLTFANSLFYVPFVFGIGVLTAISVFTSNARGSGDTAAGRASCRLGVHISTLLGLLLFGVMWVFSLNLEMFGQPKEVEQNTELFFMIIMASMVPALMSMALKNHADALDRPWPPFWIFLGGVLLNVFLNWVMIYGNLGCPAWGLEGAAIATLIARIAILVAMFVWLYRASGLREWVPYHWFRMPENAETRKFLGVGIPASLQMICEVSAFSAAGLLMGKFGATAMAAHQVALMCAATAFMVPLGLSMALSVRIGSANGAGEFHRLRK